MNYCSDCGKTVTLAIPDGDDKPRFVCSSCKAIHYQNPKMVVGSIACLDGNILLCKRAIEPSRGKWTLPAGYLENGETISQCAQRETREEACAQIKNLEPYILVNLPFINQIYFMFRAQLCDSAYAPGPESLEVRLFSLEQIPWSELAFESIKRILEHYCSDAKDTSFPFRVTTVNPDQHKGHRL